ncbi:hypothetical protein PLCT2_02174 [Planctomycetaceae bacterium]|nr:hypothetical protein PLCT2_02174 [Planctomycetaceae bacterium]
MTHMTTCFLFKRHHPPGEIISLEHILECLTESASQSEWQLVELDGIGNTRLLGVDIGDLMEEVNKPGSRKILNWSQLTTLAKCLEDILDITVFSADHRDIPANPWIRPSPFRVFISLNDASWWHVEFRSKLEADAFHSSMIRKCPWLA